MADYNIDTLVRDPDFQGRPFGERQAILKEADPSGYGKLDTKAQSAMLVDMKSQDWWKPVISKPAAPPVKDSWLPSRKAVAKFVRPALEGAGMVVGGAAGVAAGAGVMSPVLGVAGTALGYGMGSQLADIIEGPEATQVRQPFVPGELSNPKYRPRTVGEEVGTQLNKLKTGAELEMGGQVVSKVGGRIVNELVDAGAKGRPLSPKRAQYKAAQEYNQIYTPSVRSAPKNELRQKEADAVMNRIGAKVQPTPGQATDNFNARKFEQSRASKDVAVGNQESFGEALINNDAEIRKAATSNAMNKLGPGQNLPPVQPRDLTGANIVGAISKGKATAKTEASKLWDKVPDYPMPADNLTSAGRVVAGKAMPNESRKIVEDMQDFISEELGKNNNTQGMQSVDRSLNKAIKKVTVAGDDETAGHLKTLRDAVRSDINTIGEAADRGDIMLSGGKVIIPSRVKADIAMVDEQIAAQQAATSPLKEQNEHLYNELVKNKYGSGISQGPNMTAEKQAASLQQALGNMQSQGKMLDYKPPAAGGEQLWVHQLFGKDAPYDDALEAATTGKWDRGWFNKDKPWNGNPNTPIITTKTTPNDVSMNKLEKSHRGGLPVDAIVYENAIALGEGRGLPLSQLKGKTAVEARAMLKKAPVVAQPSTNPMLDNLTSRRAQLQATLDAATPAENVAKAYSAAKQYSKEEVFDKFYHGAVADVLKPGGQSTGRQVVDDQISGRFFTRQGSKDLGLSLRPPKGTVDPLTGDPLTLPERITAGKVAAGEQMMPHVVEKMISTPGVVDANTGVMNIPGAWAFRRQNADVLHELGLYDSVTKVIKGQIPRSFENALEATGKFDALGTPEMTAIQAYKLVRKMAPAVRGSYGMNSEAMQGLKDYAEALRIIGRNKNVTAVGGSTTAEKATGDTTVSIGKKLATLFAVMSGHGWTYSATENIAGSLFKGKLATQRIQMDALLREAVFNNDARAALLKVANAKPANVAATVQKYLMPFVRQIGVTATQPQDQPPQEQEATDAITP